MSCPLTFIAEDSVREDIKRCQDEIYKASLIIALLMLVCTFPPPNLTYIVAIL